MPTANNQYFDIYDILKNAFVVFCKWTKATALVTKHAIKLIPCSCTYCTCPQQGMAATGIYSFLPRVLVMLSMIFLFIRILNTLRSNLKQKDLHFFNEMKSHKTEFSSVQLPLCKKFKPPSEHVHMTALLFCFS